MSGRRSVAWVAGLLAALAALVALGTAVPTPPVPLPDPGATVDWLGRTEPAAAALAVVRVLAVLAVARLLLATAVELAWSPSRRPAPDHLRRRSRLARLAAGRAARHLVRHACGVGLVVGLGAATTAAPPAGAARVAATASDPWSEPVGPAGTDRPATEAPATRADPDPDTDPVLHGLEPEPVLHGLEPEPVLHGLEPDAATPTDEPGPAAPTTTAASSTPPPAAAEPPVALPGQPAVVPDGEGPGPGPATTPGPGAGTGRPDPAPEPWPPAPGPRPDPPPAAGGGAGPIAEPGPSPVAAGPRPGGRYVIVGGDHLWGIAERALATHLGQPPAVGAVAGYLGAVIEANRAVLVVPDDPDLVFPGQEVALPALPPVG